MLLESDEENWIRNKRHQFIASNTNSRNTIPKIILQTKQYFF